MEDKYEAHLKIINDFLDFLYRNQPKKSPFILKGGTALLRCYKLNRFSEDIDLDCNHSNNSIFKIIEEFCNIHKFEFRIAKDSELVKRCLIHYPNEFHPLKIEISYRNTTIDCDTYTDINNTIVYNIDYLFMQKMNAYTSRDKLRDLFDVTFIYINYKNSLNKQLLMQAKEVIGFKGLGQLEYLLKTDDDVLIDKDILTTNFLTMYNDLGLLSNTD